MTTEANDTEAAPAPTTVFEIRDRWDGSLKFACELTPEIASASYRLRLGFAVRAGVTAKADLRYTNLRGADLGGADLRYTYLGGADLRNANLGGANLRYTDLRYTDLRYTDLRGADLRGADLRGANLGDADLFIVETLLFHFDLIGMP